MYTLLELQAKTFGELKKIGYELNVLPEGDQRYRQSWIDAIAGVNPPLLQLLEVAPPASVEQVQQPIIETAETSPGVEVEPVQEAIVLVAKTSPGVKVEQAQEPIVPVAKTSAAKDSSSKKVKANSYLDCPSCGIGRLRVKQSIYWETSCTKCGHFAESILYPFTPAVTGYKAGDWVKLRVKPRLATNIRRGEVVCIEKVSDNYLRFVNPNLNPALVLWARRQLLHPHEVSPCEPPFVKAAETSPGVKTEATVSESAIVPVVKNHIEEESDRNPILTGIHLSDKFLARYSPPQPDNIRFQSNADGQLSLLNFEVVTESEPPDPDDFESLDAFREAIARWDCEHPSTLDHCSDLPSSVYREPPDPDDFDSMFAFWAAYDAWDKATDDDDSDEPPSSEDNDVSSEDEPLELSLDSFCLWAHSPVDWYEPVVLFEQSKVSELSLIGKSSITSDFSIPIFDAWCDRLDGSDEPPDTGIYARLPKPKPPCFPPTALGQARAKRIPNSTQTHTKYIPKVSRTHTHCIVASSSTQPARSPPGGDVVMT